MQEMIRVDSAPAKLTANFEELRAHLDAELERYDTVVSIDGLGDAKKAATELNQTAQVIDERRKTEVAKVSEPVKRFDEQMKDLVQRCKAARQKILDQVKRYEDAAKEEVRGLLHYRREALWQEHDVAEAFRRAEFDDLVKLTATTAKGNLTKATEDTIAARVRDDRALQDRTERRLVELENQSWRAGLRAPLTRDHVEPFLFAGDEAYQRELDRILAAEVKRQDAADARLAEQREREARVAQERAEQEAERKAEAEAPPAPAAAEPERQAEPPWEGESQFEGPSPDGDGLVGWRVTCTFEVRVAPSATPAGIKAELRKVMAAAGITTLSSVEVAHAEAA